MLYFVLRPLTRIALKAYFRRITINGLANLPKNKPLIICSNHPTGFIEPCLMACFLPRTLHFLVRGDLFEKPVLGKILVSTNQIPIYRFRDGYEKLRNNKEVMNISYNKLSEGEAILIFPEASTKEVKHLRPIAKGAARMALETLNHHPGTELSIVPIGINYSSPNRWRSYVNINIGEPIIPRKIEKEQELRKEALRLTRLLDQRLSDQLLVLNEGVEHAVLDKVMLLGQWEVPVSSSILVKYEEHEKSKQERALSESLHSNIRLSELDEVVESEGGMRSVHMGDVALALLISPLVLVALALNCLPVLFGMIMRNRYVREREFYASVAIAASLGMYIILFLVVLTVLLIAYGAWGFLLFLLPGLGLLGLVGYDFIVKVYTSIKLKATLGGEKKESLLKAGLDLLTEIREGKH